MYRKNVHFMTAVRERVAILDCLKGTPNIYSSNFPYPVETINKNE